MCFIERETQNFILKFREIFLQRETMLRTHRMKSDEKPFFCQFMQLFEKNDTYCDWQVFFFISERLKIFLNPRLSLIVPLRMVPPLQNCIFS